MQKLFDQFYALVFFGYMLLLQPLWGYVAARWLTRRWVLRRRPVLGWLIGLGSLAGVFLLGLAGVYFHLWLARQSCGGFPTCMEYAGLSLVIHYGSGMLSLLIFLLTAAWVTRKNRPAGSGSRIPKKIQGL